METWIGAGGWGYFRGPSGNPLGDYARAFRFVEVNSTFYRHPPLVAARRWRRAVPADFRFAVKAHRSITHGERFLATRRALASLAGDAAIAHALRADVLVLETPADLRFARAQIAALRDFGAATGPRLRIALEPRAYSGKPLPPGLDSALREIGGVDVVDLSKGELPRVDSDVLYTRLLGKGEHNVWEYSDEELREIEGAARSHESNRMVFTFHGVRMYKDAARFLQFRATGVAPAATRQRGVLSLEEVLKPDARFPATRAELVRGHGWKVVTDERGRNVHAGEYLRRIPARVFTSLHELLSVVKPSADLRV